MKPNALVLAVCMLFVGAVLGGVAVYSVKLQHSQDTIPNLKPAYPVFKSRSQVACRLNN